MNGRVKDLEREIDVLLTDIQVADRLNLRVQTLRNWRFLNRGPAYRRLGSAIRYSQQDIRDWLEDHKIIPAD